MSCWGARDGSAEPYTWRLCRRVVLQYIAVSCSNRWGAVLLFVRVLSAAGPVSCDVDGVLLCKDKGHAQALYFLLLCWRCYGRPMVDGTSIVAGG